MAVSSWVPYLVGLVLVFMGIPISYFLPETLDEQPAAEPTSEEPLLHRLSNHLKEFIRSSRFLWKGNTLLALFMFLATILSRQ